MRVKGGCVEALFFRHVAKPARAGWATDGEAVNKLLKRVVPLAVCAPPRSTA